MAAEPAGYSHIFCILHFWQENRKGGKGRGEKESTGEGTGHGSNEEQTRRGDRRKEERREEKEETNTSPIIHIIFTFCDCNLIYELELDSVKMNQQQISA